MNQFGRIFQIMIYGESHQTSMGVLIDGVPAGLKVSIEDLKKHLERRKPQAVGGTKRIEVDEPIIESGVWNGYTTGAPILVRVLNNNVHRSDYDFSNSPRPSHADYVANQKYHGFSDMSGGGHFSGRVTLGYVIAGYFAQLIYPFSISTEIEQIGMEREKGRFDEYVKYIQEQKDSVGAILKTVVNPMPPCLGEPLFEGVESKVSSILYSIPGIKGVEFGDGMKGIEMLGSQYNDRIIDSKGTTETNHSGGINGGISNGNPFVVRTFVRPTASIAKPQMTWNFEKNEIDELIIQGRHDACIGLRMPVIIESAICIALADLYLIHKLQEL